MSDVVQSLPSQSATQRTPARLGWRASDLWRAPLTDLPVRDELIRQFVPLFREMRLLEAGPGSGFAAWRLARAVENFAVIEVSAANAAALARRFLPARLSMINEDLCRDGLGLRFAASFDAILCIEVLEFLGDPMQALTNLALMLSPGGTLYLNFPNYSTGLWPTYYRTRAEFDGQMRGAGFASWEIFELRLSPWAQFVYRTLHEFPLAVYRRRESHRSRRPNAPQNYEQTWAFHHGGRFERIKLPLHLYWASVMLLMRLGGDVFQRVKCDDEIFNRNLFVVATAAKDGNAQ
ncbi:MAG: methyltransferase domain-containing protein [Acidobacteriota bacterium]|nr:methyltransferase domain-containing protein [Acidobacteriota bacterium]